MKASVKSELQTKLTAAIQKVLDASPPLGTLTTRFTAVHMATAAIFVLEVTKDANDEWQDDGYLKF